MSKKKLVSLRSTDTFGSFNTTISDSVASEFRRRLLMMKIAFEKIVFLRMKVMIEDDFSYVEANNLLKEALGSIIRIKDFTFISNLDKKQDTVYYKTTVDDIKLDGSGLYRDLELLTKGSDFQKIYDLNDYKKKLSSLHNIAKNFKSNYYMKIERFNFESNFPCIIVLHIENPSAGCILSDDGLGTNLINLLVKYSDLVLEHKYYEIIEDYMRFLEEIQNFLKEVIINLEYLMLPKLIKVIEDCHKVSCSYFSGHSSQIEMFKKFTGGILIGYMNEYVKIPTVINKVNDDYIELDNLISQIWIKVKGWMIKQNERLEAEMVYEDMGSNFILIFDHKFKLHYVNGFERDSLGRFFTFPQKITNSEQLTLKNLIKHKVVEESMISIIDDMIKKGARVYDMNKPNITIKISYSIKGMFKFLTLIVKYANLSYQRDEDFYSQFDYVLGKSPDSSVYEKATLGAMRSERSLSSRRGTSNLGSMNKGSLGKKSQFGGSASHVQIRKFSGFKPIHRQTINPKSQKYLERKNLEEDNLSVEENNPSSPPKKLEKLRNIRGGRRKKAQIKSTHFSNPAHHLDIGRMAKDDTQFRSTFHIESKREKSKPYLAVEQLQRNVKRRSRSKRKAFNKLNDIANSIAMEFIPRKIKNRETKVGLPQIKVNPPAPGDRRNSIASFFTYADNKNNAIPQKGSYDLQSEGGKEVLEIMARKREKVEKKVKFMSMIPKPSEIFNNVSIENLNSWNLNTLDMNKIDLISVIRDVFVQMGIFKNYEISINVFTEFMWSCNYYYTRNNNPFHNFYHGVTVAHSCYVFINQCKKLKELLSPDEQFAFVVSGLGHDLDHRGKNNTYEINTKSDLAIRYHDYSPLEQHHAAILFKILTHPKTDLMTKVSPEKSKDLRKMMIENIKNTDMSVHFKMLKDFKLKLEEDPEFGVLEGRELVEEDLDDLKKDKIMITNLFLHTADLSGASKNIKLANRWSKLVNEEFTAQYNEERRKAITVTPHFANLSDEKTFYKSELGFLKFIVIPLYELADEWSEDMEEMITCINGSFDYYQKKLDHEKKLEAEGLKILEEPSMEDETPSNTNKE